MRRSRDSESESHELSVCMCDDKAHALEGFFSIVCMENESTPRRIHNDATSFGTSHWGMNRKYLPVTAKIRAKAIDTDEKSGWNQPLGFP